MSKTEICLYPGEEVNLETMLGVFTEQPQGAKNKLKVGDWYLQDLLEARVIMDDLFDYEIKKRLSEEEKDLYDQIKAKKQKKEAEVKEELTAEEKELYEKIYPDLAEMRS